MGGNLSMCRSIKTVRQFERLFESYRMRFKDFLMGGKGGGGSSSHKNVSAEKKERKLKRLWGRTINVFADFSPCTVGVWT